MANFVKAQSEITGFLGVGINDKSFIAVNSIKKRCPNAVWKHPCIYVKGVTFIGQKFDSLTVRYENEKLAYATFSLKRIKNSASTYIRRYEENEQAQNAAYENAKIQIRRDLTNELNSIFFNIANTMSSKYGSPIVASEGNAIWKDIHSNTITLNCTIRNSELRFDRIFTCKGVITVTYRPGIANDNEF